jgi:hypothetical protein
MVKRKKKGMKMTQAPAARGATLRNRGALKNLVISHREYIGEVVSDGSGSQRVVYPINPGLSSSFPWLSAIAVRFETYMFSKLTFLYCSSVGTDTDGTVALCPDYDPDDDNESLTKASYMQFADSIRMPIWETKRMNCTPKNLRKRRTYFTRSRAVQNRKDFDTCSLAILYTSSDTMTIGELWVEYTIHLETPQIQDEYDAEAMASNSTGGIPDDAIYSDSGNPDNLQTIVSNCEGVFEFVDESTLRINQAGRYLLTSNITDSASGLALVASMAAGVNATKIDGSNAPGANSLTDQALFDVVIPNPGDYAEIGGTNYTVVGSAETIHNTFNRVDPYVFTSL